jgi:hypothetical protein
MFVLGAESRLRFFFSLFGEVEIGFGFFSLVI